MLKEIIKETLNNDDFEVIKKWVDSLNIGSKAPRGLKNEFVILKKLKDIVDSKNISSFDKANAKTYYRALLSKKDEITKKLANKQSDIIKKDGITFIKADKSAYSKFLNAVDDIDEFLKTLKGFHKKVLKNLKIRFVSASDIKSKAQYKKAKDEIWIKLSGMGNTKDDYGSLRYVLLHELGHRYLKLFPQKWDIDDIKWVTTPYSEVDSINGEEKFAELFALSNWKEKYPQYKKQIAEFDKMIK